MDKLLAASELIGDAATRQDMGTTASDLWRLYQTYNQMKAGKLSLRALVKANAFIPLLYAVNRTSALLIAMVQDKATGAAETAKIEDLIEPQE